MFSIENKMMLGKSHKIFFLLNKGLIALDNKEFGEYLTIMFWYLIISYSHAFITQEGHETDFTDIFPNA